MEDYLVVVNVNARDYIHRVQLGPPGQRIRIESTCLTNTNDLLALVHIDDQYKLFLIDLDAYDLTNFEETQKNPQSLFYSG